MSQEVSEVTRRTIIDYLIASDVHWSGRLPDDDFLARLYDLTTLPSQDSRFRTAADDIHRALVRVLREDLFASLSYESRMPLPTPSVALTRSELVDSRTVTWVCLAVRRFSSSSEYVL